MKNRVLKVKMSINSQGNKLTNTKIRKRGPLKIFVGASNLEFA